MLTQEGSHAGVVERGCPQRHEPDVVGDEGVVAELEHCVAEFLLARSLLVVHKAEAGARRGAATPHATVIVR